MQRHIISILVAAALCGCGHAAHDSHSAEGEAAHEEHAHEHVHGHEGHSHAGGEIKVDEHAAGRFGLKVDTVSAGTFATTVRTSGTVMNSGVADAVVSAPTAGIVRFSRGINAGSDVRQGAVIATIDTKGVSGGDANLAAKAALDAAKTEYERIEALYKEQLATVGERNAALAAYNTAKAAYSPAASTGSAVAPISGTVTSLAVREGQYVGAGEVIATVAAAGDLTLRIDLPQREYGRAAAFTDAVAEFSYLDGPVSVSELGGRRIGSAPMPAQGTSSAYLPVYFSVPRGSGILPGSTFTAYLLGSPRSGVVSVPVSALSEQQGKFFVYEQIHDDAFVKVPVTVGATDGRRVEITSGLHPGVPVVVEGVTTVRLAEAGENIPEGHTHNH